MNIKELRGTLFERANSVSDLVLKEPEASPSFNDISIAKKFAIDSIEEISVPELRRRLDGNIKNALNLVNDDGITKKVCRPFFALLDDLMWHVKRIKDVDKRNITGDNKREYVYSMMQISMLMEIFHIMFKLGFLPIENYGGELKDLDSESEKRKSCVITQIGVVLTSSLIGDIPSQDNTTGVVMDKFLKDLGKIDPRWASRAKKKIAKKGMTVETGLIFGYELRGLFRMYSAMDTLTKAAR